MDSLTNLRVLPNSSVRQNLYVFDLVTSDPYFLSRLDELSAHLKSVERIKMEDYFLLFKISNWLFD